MRKTIEIKNNVGYGDFHLNNLNKNIKNINDKCKKINKELCAIQNFDIKTRFGTINCNEKNTNYTIKVTYTEGTKSLSRTATFDTSNVNQKLQKSREKIKKLISDLQILEENSNKSKSILKNVINELKDKDKELGNKIDENLKSAKNFLPIDEDKEKFENLNLDTISGIEYVNWNQLNDLEKEAILKKIDEINATPNSTITVGKDANGNYLFIQTRVVSSTEFNSIIVEHFSENIENRQYTIDNLHSSDGHSIAFENGDIYRLTESGALHKVEGSIIKSHSINYDGGKFGSLEVGNVTGSYYTFLGIPVGINAKVGFAEANLGPSSAESYLFNGSFGLIRESEFENGVEKVDTSLKAHIALIGAEGSLFKNDNKFGDKIDLNKSFSIELGVGVEAGISYKKTNGNISGLGFKYDLSAIIGTENEMSINIPDFKSLTN